MSISVDSDDAFESDPSGAEDVETEASSIMNEEYEVGELKHLLRDRQEDIEGACKWVCWGSLSDGVNPGLSLTTSGIVGLPLSTQEAARIIQESELGSSGSDEAQESSNMLCKLSTDRFELRNPAWQEQGSSRSPQRPLV